LLHSSGAKFWTKENQLKIQYTSKINASNGIKTLVYGPSGIGKTRLLATAPNPFIFSAEEGLLSLRKQNIPYVDVSNYKDLVDAFTWVMKSNEARQFQTFGLDSLSEIAEVVLTEKKRGTNDGRRAYGQMQDEIMPLCRMFRDIPQRNVVVIGKQQIVEEGMTKKAVPILPSETLKTQMPYFWDLVLHMFVGYDPTAGRYVGIHTQEDVGWSAKDRSGNLTTIEYPDLSYIFKKAAA
jgi:hypothetical protein